MRIPNKIYDNMTIVDNFCIVDNFFHAFDKLSCKKFGYFMAFSYL